LQPADVRQFIADQLAHRATPAKARLVASALRAYFRYRGACGNDVHALKGIIVLPAHWRLASLPRSLSDDEVDRLLNAFPPELPSCRRGYAMVRCALDLGLRQRNCQARLDRHRLASGHGNLAEYQIAPRG
jgi:integrase